MPITQGIIGLLESKDGKKLQRLVIYKSRNIIGLLESKNVLFKAKRYNL